MEYIEGKTIGEIKPSDFGKTWNEYFKDAIEAFSYLHNNQILHRDVRPANFMIDKYGSLKIIDFGFGKKNFESDGADKNSVYLNWPASTHPDEVVEEKGYDKSTEVYYVGELFRHLVKGDKNFKYTSILEKMVKRNRSERYKNFDEIKEAISVSAIKQNTFSDEQRKIYREFADELIMVITKFSSEPKFITDADEVLKNLEPFARTSSIESTIYNSSDIIQCFTPASFYYNSNQKVRGKIFSDFYEMLLSLNNEARAIIIDAIVSRLKSVKVEIENDNLDLSEVPF